MDITQVLSEMTLEEKASLCSGLDMWHTRKITRLGVPSVMMADGPHGLRKEKEGDSQPILKDSYPSTCFPTASALASTWNRELIGRIGVALGEECLTAGVSVILGPGVNIKRSPLCGRNFEYFFRRSIPERRDGGCHDSRNTEQRCGVILETFRS